MIGITKLSMVKTVFFHRSCPDGTASAVICRQAFRLLDGEMPEFRSLQYDTDEHKSLQPGPGHLFVDVTPPLTRWREWEGHSPVVLDHHVTAKDATEGLGGVYATNDAHSGAMLAYEQVLVPAAGDPLDVAKWRGFAELAMIRDTWKKDHPLWDEACAQAEALTMLGSESLIADVDAGRLDIDGIMALGRTLLDKQRRKAKQMATSALWDETLCRGETYRIAVFNCTDKLTSDAANMLIEQGADVAAGFHYRTEEGDTHLGVSLRSAGRVDVSTIAAHYGGGGHKMAAGFSLHGASSKSPADVISAIKSCMWRQAKG